jgi:microcystin-dependent protein
MSQPFVGQIQPLAFGFAPRGWAQCNGQTLSISQNTALFSLLGTMYGGNGVSTFMLPNLQSAVPMHVGTSLSGDTYVQGESAGEEQVQLTLGNMPLHNHLFFGTTGAGTQTPPGGNPVLSKIGGNGHPYYAPDTTPQSLNPASLSTVGGNAAHPNIQPYLAINWCISLAGIYPSRS